jgi:hypothetical protein
MRMCHDSANVSGSSTPASAARRATTERMYSRWAEVVAMEPLVEDVEDGEELLARGRAAPARFGFDELPRPALLAPLQEREHEILLRAKVPVQRRPSDARSLDDLLGPDGADPAPGEELVGRVEDSLASTAGSTGFGRRRRSEILPGHELGRLRADEHRRAIRALELHARHEPRLVAADAIADLR